MAKRKFVRDTDSAVVTRESLVSYYILKYYNLFMNAYKFTGLDYQQKDFLPSLFRKTLSQLEEAGVIKMKGPCDSSFEIGYEYEILKPVGLHSLDEEEEKRLNKQSSL